MDKPRVFTASRLTAGNFPFPTRIEVSLERVAQIRRGHRNADAYAIRDLIELNQKESSKVV
jgi:hypothetical protein